ncbi:MAG: ribonuclease III domain-containing protein [Candidatus Thermoplasmatota archaeon]|jgi:ribonuclease-3|nr:ribonuclease III domain-containing protein [Candidatus Thermoplasmatota archaeon]
MIWDEYEKLEEKINYTFKNKELLKRALTHKTYAFEANTPLEYNERLELLGDSILSFIVAEQLYKSNKYFSEGELTRRRAILVNNNFLAEKARELSLGKYLLLGKGEKKQDGDKNPTNLANALEALIGAIYLDSDIDNVRKFILNNLFSEDFQF